MTGDLPAPALRTSPWAIASLLCSVGMACPLLSLLAPLLGLKAIAHIRCTPGVGGHKLAIAGIVLGLLGIVLWVVVARVWHVEVRTKMLAGPTTELLLGIHGDIAGFKRGFTEDGATRPDIEAAGFLGEVSRRYGQLSAVQQDHDRSPPEPGRMSEVIPYILHFENGSVPVEARLKLFAHGVSAKWEYIVLLDDDAGDLSYPAGIDRLPVSTPEPHDR